MDLTRRIIEGIHEVELQVTPEFQKPERKGSTTWDMNDAFEANGWKQAKVHKRDDTFTYIYEHPTIPGAEMRYSFSAHSGLVVGPMIVRSSAESEPMRFDAEPSVVEGLTNEWLEVGKKYAPIKGVEQALEPFGWKPMDIATVHSTFTDVVFKHPGAQDTIVVRYSKYGAITSARVEHPDKSISAFHPSVENIVVTAKTLMSEVEG